MLHKEFFGLLFLAFVGWIFIGGNPNERIDRFCEPINWTGSVIVSGAAFAIPSTQETLQKYFNKFDYGCRYVTWRLFYQSDYTKWQLSHQPLPAQPASAASAPASAASAAAKGKK